MPNVMLNLPRRHEISVSSVKLREYAVLEIVTEDGEVRWLAPGTWEAVIHDPRPPIDPSNPGVY